MRKHNINDGESSESHQTAHSSLADAKSQYVQGNVGDNNNNNIEAVPRKQKSAQKKKRKKKDQAASTNDMSAAKAQYRQQNTNGNAAPAPTPPSPATRGRPRSQPGAFRVYHAGNSSSDNNNASTNGGATTLENNDDHGNGNEAPVIEAFMQEGGQNDEEMQPRQPPSAMAISSTTPTSTSIHTFDKQSDKRGKAGSNFCSYRLILILALCFAAVIVIAIVVAVVLILGREDDDNNGGNVVSPSTIAPSAAPSSSPSGATRDNSFPLLMEGVNVDAYSNMGISAVQYGFDIADCFSSSETPTIDAPVVTLRCPGSSAIVLLGVIGFAADGDEQKNPPLDCEVKSTGRITCTYREILQPERVRQTTIFIAACASDTVDAEVNFESETLTGTSCPDNPSVGAQSLSIGHFCDDAPSGSDTVIFKFGTGEKCLQGTEDSIADPLLEICGAAQSCSHGVDGPCTLTVDSIKAQMEVDTQPCSIFERDEWGGTYSGILDSAGEMINILNSDFILPNYAELSSAALSP